MALKPGLELMARYNQWMNDNLQRACAGLAGAELAADRGAYFGSVLGTLNHLLVGDIIWLKRIARHLPDVAALGPVHTWDEPQALNEALAADLDSWAATRRTLDTVIVHFVGEVSESQLAAPLSYTNLRGQSCNKTLGLVLLHVFNHQTHHRGQITTLLSQAGVDPGVTDLLVTIPET